jgi:hypothetical protein
MQGWGEPIYLFRLVINTINEKKEEWHGADCKEAAANHMSDVNEWPETGCNPFRLNWFRA